MMKNRLELAALGCYYTQGFSKARIKSLKTVIGALHWSLIAYLYFKIRKICLGKACES